eukprot:15437098-Alexandrium_andersonii.AAC.1
MTNRSRAAPLSETSSTTSVSPLIRPATLRFKLCLYAVTSGLIRCIRMSIGNMDSATPLII